MSEGIALLYLSQKKTVKSEAKGSLVKKKTTTIQEDETPFNLIIVPEDYILYKYRNVQSHLK